MATFRVSIPIQLYVTVTGECEATTEEGVTDYINDNCHSFLELQDCGSSIGVDSGEGEDGPVEVELDYVGDDCVQSYNHEVIEVSGVEVEPKKKTA